MRARTLLCLGFFGLSCGHAPPAHVPSSQLDQGAPRSPDEEYGELFERVQLGRVFIDQKTFVLERFSLPYAEESIPPTGLELIPHIEWLWPRLTREAKNIAPGHSLIAL